MPHLDHLAAAIRAKLNSRGLPIALLRFADRWKQQRHQIPIMLGDGIGIEAVNGVQPIARPDSPVVFQLLLRNLFGSMSLSVLLEVPRRLLLLRRDITPGSERNRCLPEIALVAEPNEVQNVAALHVTPEAVKSAAVEIHTE
jgi:hypothetical protein